MKLCKCDTCGSKPNVYYRFITDSLGNKNHIEGTMFCECSVGFCANAEVPSLTLTSNEAITRLTQHKVRLQLSDQWIRVNPIGMANLNKEELQASTPESQKKERSKSL